MSIEFEYYAAYPGNEAIALAVTATAARFAIPTRLRGHLCAFLSDGADCDVLFGTSTVAAVYGQASGVSSEVITPHAQTGSHLISKVQRLIRIPKDPKVTHFSVDCVAAGSGTLYIEIVD
jgi:hypothetical protein